MREFLKKTTVFMLIFAMVLSFYPTSFADDTTNAINQTPAVNGSSVNGEVNPASLPISKSTNEQNKSELSSLIIHTSTAPSDTNVLVKNSSDTYSSGIVFSSDTFSYTLSSLPDTTTQLRFRALPKESGATVSIYYYNNGSKDITWQSGSSKWANCLTYGKNTFQIVVTPPSSSQNTVATYTFTIDLVPAITSLSLAAGEAQLYLDKAFAYNTNEYSVTVPCSAETVTVSPTFRSSNYYATYNGVKSNTVNVKNTNKIDVVVYSDDTALAVTNTYVLNLVKVDSLNFKPTVTPLDAVIKVYDQNGNEVKKRADGSFEGLFSKYTYTYTVAKYGYIAQSGSVSSSGGALNVVLKKAVSSPITGVDAYWKNFRNSDYNMAITDVATPINVTDTSLLWNKTLGSGWSAAPSAQIIVDDALVVMSSTSIYKLDLETGEILATGTMCDAPSFSYTPPTYAQGMIFCPLSNGTIQAFNAKTLDSLWIYKDTLKGQSLSPITYSDGYIYTGFWNGEMNDANYVCLSVTDEDPSKDNESKIAIWKHKEKGGFYGAGGLALGDYLIVGSDDGASGASATSHLYCFNKYTGETISCLELNNAGDQRSSIAYDKSSARIYFTTKGGYLCSAVVNSANGKITSLKCVNYNAQSISTPIVYKGKVYFATGSGISSSGSSGNFVVADANSLQMLYAVELKGYPQCSLLLSTAYEKEGYLYFYSTYNNKPGGISMLKVKNAATNAADAELIELYDADGFSEFCITSIICGANGTLYYKNDSTNLLAVGVPKSTTVINLIHSIGTVTKDSAPAIKIARDAYNALSEEDRAKVTNYQTLLDAEASYNHIRSDEVTMFISNIGTVTLESENSINLALNAYNALSGEQKHLVTNYDVLIAAQTRLSELKVSECERLINLIPKKITLKCESAIVAARTYYSSLSTLEKRKVSNLNKLINSEKTLQKLKDSLPTGSTKSVTVKINGIKYTVSEKTKKAVEAIEALLFPKDSSQKLPSDFHGLTDVQKQSIINAYKLYSVLSNDEKLFVNNFSGFEEILTKFGDVNHNDINSGIKIDGLEWYVKVTITTKNITEQDNKKVRDGLGEDSALLSMYDIKLVNLLDGNEYNPGELLKVKIPVLSENLGYDSFAVVHIGDDGKVEFVQADVKDDSVNFSTTKFSFYGVAGFSGKWSDVVASGEVKGIYSSIVWIVLIALSLCALGYVLYIKKKEEQTKK